VGPKKANSFQLSGASAVAFAVALPPTISVETSEGAILPCMVLQALSPTQAAIARKIHGRNRRLRFMRPIFPAWLAFGQDYKMEAAAAATSFNSLKGVRIFSPMR